MPPSRQDVYVGQDRTAELVERLLAQTTALQRQIASIHDQLVQPAPPAIPGEAGRQHAALYAIYLGRFTLFRAHQRIGLGRNKAVTELARYLLAHAGQVIPRDVLLDLLWPDVAPARGLHRLHVAVSSLRTMLDGPQAGTSCLHFEGDSYAIEAEAVLTDCDLLEQAYRQGMQHLLRSDREAASSAFRRMLDLYGGDYLADQPYAEWTHSQRAHFSERRLAALTFLCEEAARSVSFVALQEYAQQILAIDNLRERAHRYLMRSHYALGQRACALRQYRACAAILEHDLGVAPSRETQQLYEAIRDDAELPLEHPIRP